MRTFLADDDDEDKASLNSDQMSIGDPDSPRTPQNFESKGPLRPVRLSTDSQLFKASETGYAQVPASSREMTLRMTLTRPDLRANDDLLYGWQNRGGSGHVSRKSLNWTGGVEYAPTTYVGGSQRTESMEKVFAGIDRWSPEFPG